MHIPKTESGLSKQLLSNFPADNSYINKQVEARVKDGVAYKNVVLIKFSFFLTFLYFFDIYIYSVKVEISSYKFVWVVRELYLSLKTSLN